MKTNGAAVQQLSEVDKWIDIITAMYYMLFSMKFTGK